MNPRSVLTAVLVLFGGFTVGMALGQVTELPGWLSENPDRLADGGLPPSPPTELVIPSLDISAPVDPVGLADTGGIAAPPLSQAERTGWYSDGPSPGQTGAAVIVGHIDDQQGPAVFHRIGQMRTGDRIEVTRQDGQIAVFEVTDVRSYPKTALPPEVYGDFRAPELRLITCGGEWVGGEFGYAENVVVSATLVSVDS